MQLWISCKLTRSVKDYQCLSIVWLWSVPSCQTPISHMAISMPCIPLGPFLPSCLATTGNNFAYHRLLQEPCPKDLHQKFHVWPKTCPIIAHKKSLQNLLEVLGCHLCHNIASPRSPLVHLKLAPPKGSESSKTCFDGLDWLLEWTPVTTQWAPICMELLSVQSKTKLPAPIETPCRSSATRMTADGATSHVPQLGLAVK